MSWSWQFQNTDGVAVAAESATEDSFPSQSEAESWLGETWQDLLADGVDQVVLMESGRIVYGPMSLHPPT